MGQEPQAQQALLALVCANKYKPLDPPPPTPPLPEPAADEDAYKGCTPVRKDSKFIPEAWTRIGEFHFDNPNELRLAIAAFKKVLTFKDSPYYDRALYKLAWSYYRDNRFPEAVREFDNLVKYADARKAAGQKVGSDLRPEAVQYLGVSFAEPDWDGDTVPDPETTACSARRSSTRGARTSRTCARSSSAWATSTSTRPSTPRRSPSTRRCWRSGPTTPTRPGCRTRSSAATSATATWSPPPRSARLLGRNYTKGSAWYKKNKDNPEALAVAQQLAEDALLTAATNVHAGAQACKTKWQENQKDLKKLEECKLLYRTAAELYEKYLAAYPNSKRSYEFSRLLRRRALLLGPAARRPSPPTRPCATRSSTTATRKTRPSG